MFLQGKYTRALSDVLRCTYIYRITHGAIGVNMKPELLTFFEMDKSYYNVLSKQYILIVVFRFS